nr:CooT family nickel-binding protein [Candidatus Njordarchaeum guaymaensis]
MCEFSVYDAGDPSQRIAEDIVRATTREGSLVVSKVLGESLTLDNALLVELDVSKERMMVSRSPLVGNLAKLIELTLNFKKNPTPDLYKKILALWEKTKSEGDSIIRSLRGKKQSTKSL